MKKVSILVFILIVALGGCNTKSKNNDQNTTSQRSEVAKAMDGDLLPENSGKKIPLF